MGEREKHLYEAVEVFADILGERIAEHLAARLSHLVLPESPASGESKASKLNVDPKMRQGAAKDSRRLIPVNQWNDYHEFPKLGGLRSLIFNADSNGFDKAIRRVGRRVLIDEEQFFRWVDETNKPV